MGVDARVKDLAGTVASGDLSALLNTLYLVVDDTSFTDAKKILLKTILTEAIVSSNANNYQAMTPKAFYDSVMTNARKGIGQISADLAVTNKTGNDLLTSAHQVLMQLQWNRDWFVKNGDPTDGAVYKDSASCNSMVLNINLFAEFVQYQTVQINPTIPGGKRIDGVAFQVITSHSTVANQFVAFNWLKYNGTTRYYWIDSSQIAIGLSADGKTLFVVSNYATTGNVNFSATINVILTDV